MQHQQIQPILGGYSFWEKRYRETGFSLQSYYAPLKKAGISMETKYGVNSS